MRSNQSQVVLDELNAILAGITPLIPADRRGHFEIPYALADESVSRGLAALDRIAGANSAYAIQARRELDYEQFRVSTVGGALKALRDDIAAGYTRRLADVFHADVFSDFLDMATHLLEAGYKDAAAVIAGSALESHIRKLAEKNGIDLNLDKPDGSLQPKKADLLNAELAKAEIYSALVHKNVLAWLGLRNAAAHGKYDEYRIENVRLMVDAVRLLISQYPA